MDMLNRSAIILRPKQPYLEWTRLDDKDGLAEGVFKTLHEEPTVYLLPQFDDAPSQQKVLEHCWPQLFKALLEGWVTDEALWPGKRTFRMFQEWFDVQMSGTVEVFPIDEPFELTE